MLYARAFETDPGNFEALKGIGRTLLALRRLDASADAWAAALAAAPNDAEALFQAGNVLFRRGDMDGAGEYFRQALSADPDLYGARGMNLLARLYCENTHDALWAAQREWAAHRAPSPAAPVHDNDPDPDRPLRIGFLSSDFRAHPVGFNMLPLYSRIDRGAFQLYSYAQVFHPDAATRLFEDASDGWRMTVGMSDAEVAGAVVADKIDILVVVAAHLDENRPLVARYRPAPILVNYYDICTTAMPEFDYFIGDRFVTPRGGPERFSERVIRLPNFSVHAIPAEAESPGPLPALTTGHITFGSFNAPQKITDRCIEIWAGLLRAVPGSRLALKHFEAYGETATRARLLGGFADCGVPGDRIDIVETVDQRSVHLRAYDAVDIALDPFPFNGATTTFEALLMGVPVISMTGERLVSRCAAATLDAVGMNVCVARDAADYQLRAIELASDLDRLAAIRAGLRRAVTRSRICNADRYARNLGRVYRAVWRRWCKSESKG